MNVSPSAFGSDARMTRGLELSKSATIRENEDGSFAVPSQTSGSVSQEVRIMGAAQAAGIGLTTKNKWMELLEKAVTGSGTPGEITG
jgi:hypothetical protein